MDFRSKNIINCCNRSANANGYSTTTTTTIPPTSSSHATASSSSNSSNKRKRKASVDVDSKEKEDDPPVKRTQTSCYQSETQSQSSSDVSSFPSPVDELAGISDTGSSDCLSTIAEYDLGTPTSTTTTSPENNTLTSPASCDTTLVNNSNNWRSRGDMTPNSSTGTSSKKRNKKSCDDEYLSQCCVTPTSEIRLCPLPALSWANASDVWNIMCVKDERAAYDRTSSMLENHPGLQPRMRAILLDWLIEVCEVYKLHRETYYLAVDYLDRYLSTQKKVQKTHLQLIGITCLFVAAKVEEIYPPKIGEFAYVTDGACQEEDILQHELLLLKALDWSISPVTIMGWLGVYMQLNVSNRTPASLASKEDSVKSTSSSSSKSFQEFPINSSLSNRSKDLTKISQEDNNNRSKSGIGSIFKKNAHSRNSIPKSTAKTNDSSDGYVTEKVENDAFIYPQFSGMEFAQTAQLIDLCSLDLGMANFPYSVIAAAAMSHTFSREIALRVSGLEWETISSCVRWMEPFFYIVCEESKHLFLLEQNDQVKSKYGLGHICPNIITDDSHIIQTHATSMAMFDRALLRREQYETAVKIIKQESSPAVEHLCPAGLLTPPASSRKPLDDAVVNIESDSHNNKIHVKSS